MLCNIMLVHVLSLPVLSEMDCILLLTPRSARFLRQLFLLLLVAAYHCFHCQCIGTRELSVYHTVLTVTCCLSKQVEVSICFSAVYYSWLLYNRSAEQKVCTSFQSNDASTPCLFLILTLCLWILKDAFVLIAQFDRGLFCPSDNAVDAINHPTLFCKISGENESSGFIAWHVGIGIPTYKSAWLFEKPLGWFKLLQYLENYNTKMGHAIYNLHYVKV